MSFVQPAFLLFLPLVLVVYWGLGRRRWQNAWLLCTSAVFYGWVHPWFLGLLAFSTLLDFGVGLGMARWPARRRALLALSLAGNLGMLAAFKYWNFFLENVGAALGALGLHPGLPVLQVLLPVGISFYTFQTLSYTIDVARGRIQPKRDLLDYATFVAMFPQLVAGPVERAAHLLPQLEAPRRFDAAGLRAGLTLALWGAFQKVVIADSLAPYVDRAFSVREPSIALLAAGGVAFSLQILADFAGYTDIARGTARMMGFELRRNFDAPYAARTPAELWHRWHISFSTWIRDYLYIPLGGSRGPAWRVALVTLLTMLLAGLWHGASWNFVAWGAFHGLLLVTFRPFRPTAERALVRHPALGLVAIPVMYCLTCAGWVLFRQQDLGALAHALTHPAGSSPASQAVIAVALLGLSASAALPLLSAHALRRRLLPRLLASGWEPFWSPLLWAALAACLFLFAREAGRDFIYFRF
ncbi:MAG: MBOAT family O-acyltransferase [Pseudomonadota bacterium]